MTTASQSLFASVSRLTVRIMLCAAAGAAAVTGAHAQLVRIGSGATTTAARDAFRVDLGGGTVAGANGLFSDGTGERREINWDGVPDSFAAPNNLPPNFFNANSPRGAVFSTPGSGFQVSANAGVAPIEFDTLDPSYSSTFAAFSPQRLFTALGSNIVDVGFFVPGTSTPGLVRGFGSIFSDVDLANTTSIQFFDASNNSLGTFFVPNLIGSETLSFLGVSFAIPIISRVRITNGNTALGAGITDNGTTRDLVVMDDFLFSNPTVVPEPGTWLMMLTGLGIVGGIARRRRSQSQRVATTR